MSVIGKVVGVDFTDGTVISVRVPDGTRWGKLPVEIRIIDRMTEAELLSALESIVSPNPTPLTENKDE